MDAGTRLLGAGIALGSAALGVIGEAVKGYIVRKYANDDKRKVFQHRTAIELQETVYDLVRTTALVLNADSEAFQVTGKWGIQQIPDNVNEQHRLLTARVNLLIERLDDQSLRTAIDEVLDRAPRVVKSESQKDAVESIEALIACSNTANKALGKVIRESWPV